MDPIDDAVTALSEELKMAFFWHRPSILVAVYRSRLNLHYAQFFLAKKLRRNKQTVLPYLVSPANFDIPLVLSEMPDTRNNVFFISGLSQGGGLNNLNAFRALNFRRELLVDHLIRAVFWLDETEASLLPTQALDFWAFRHRLLELFQEPTARRMKNLVGNLDWPAWNQAQLRKELPEGLALREELLNSMPAWKQAPALRAALTHMLAGLHWAQAEYGDALTLLQDGLVLAQPTGLPALQARFWTGIGLVHASLGQNQPALQAFENALKLDPDASEAWTNLAKVQRTEGRLPSALAAAQHSVSSGAKVAENWINLGNIYNELGRHQEAIPAYKKALSIDKKDPQTWLKLGDTYRLLGRPADSLPSFRQARLLDTTDAETWLKLGLAYRDVGLLSRAIRALYKASRLNPLAAVPWKRLGELYQANNHLKSARKAYKTAAALDPKDETIRYSLDACYLRKRKLLK